MLRKKKVKTKTYNLLKEKSAIWSQHYIKSILSFLGFFSKHYNVVFSTFIFALVFNKFAIFFYHLLNSFVGFFSCNLAVFGSVQKNVKKRNKIYL